jgi:hypothetical protein
MRTPTRRPDLGKERSPLMHTVADRFFTTASVEEVKLPCKARGIFALNVDYCGEPSESWGWIARLDGVRLSFSDQ